jgi:hypothetical protein
MSVGRSALFFLAALFACCGTVAVGAAELDWPEAVGRLTVQRTRAETCAALLKSHANKQQLARGEMAYDEAKADFDGVIAELNIALTQGGTPKSLQNLDASLEHGETARAKFCQDVSVLLPKTQGERGVLGDLAKEAVKPVFQSISEGVAALYNNHRKDDELTRATIKTQLEAAKWPNFADVKAAK